MTASPFALPVLSTKRLRSWPKYETGGRVGYQPAAAALRARYTTDAHTAAYSVPSKPRRLKKEAPGQPVDGSPLVVPVAFLFVDVDGADHKADPAWREGEAAKSTWALAELPGGFFYQTRGGYRLVWRLAQPFPITGPDDAARWRLHYWRALLSLSRRFAIEGDPACSDWTRLYRLPHATRPRADGSPGEAPEELPTEGDPELALTQAFEPDPADLDLDLAEARRLDALYPATKDDDGKTTIAGPWGAAVKALAREAGEGESSGGAPVVSTSPSSRPAPPRGRRPDHEERQRLWTEKALDNMAADLGRASKGNRNTAARDAALVLGHYAPHLLNPSDIESRLLAATRAAGWDNESKTLDTIRRAVSDGMREPKWPELPADEPRRETGRRQQRPRPTDHSTTKRAPMPDPTTDEHHQGDELPAPFLPLATSHDLPAFPLGALPDVVGRYVHQLAEHLEVPVDLPATLALGVLASVCMRRFVVQPRPGWTETTNLYLVAALDPGERKTPAFRKVLGPLYAIQKERVEGWKKLCKDLAKQRSEEREDKAGKEAKKLEPLPPRPRLFVDDATPEKLAMVLLEQGERITLASDEGGVFQMMTGLYSKSGQANTGVYLKSHDGGQYTVDRMSREALYLEAPAMTMALAVQPEVIRALAKRPDLRGIGLWARFCYCMPASRVGSRTYDAPDVETDVRDHWHRLVKDLDTRARALNEGREEPVTVMFSPEAWRRLHAAVVAIDRAMLPGAALASVRDWASKLGGLIVRLAGLLHLAEVEEPERWTVDADTVERAIDLGRYFLAHARHVFDVEMSLDPAEQAARQAWAAIERRGATRVTPADVGRWVKSLRKSPDALAALGVLCERGYLVLDRHHKGKGRVYLVKVTPSHPKATKVTQKSDLSSEPDSQGNPQESEGKAPQAGEALHASPPWPTPGDLGDLGDFGSPEAKSGSGRPQSAGDMPGDLPGDFRGPGSSNEPTTTPPPVSGVATAPAANDPDPGAELEVLDVIEAEGAEG